MPETPHSETEVLLMVLKDEPLAEVLGYLWETFTLNELDDLHRRLARLDAMTVHVADHKRHATEHLPDCGEVAPPGRGC